MIELYHAEPASNSLKVLLCLKEKGIDFRSHVVDIQAFQQHEPQFLQINPDGQVPVLVHDGVVVTESTVINEYRDHVFPEPPLRPADPRACARMRLFTKYVDEHLRHALSQISWQLMIHTITDKLTPEEFAARLARIPREEKREKWRISAAQGYTPEQLAASRRTLQESIGKMEAALSRGPWLAGETHSLADIACFSMTILKPKRYGDFMNDEMSPRVMEWQARMMSRPAVQAALATPGQVRTRAAS